MGIPDHDLQSIVDLLLSLHSQRTHGDDALVAGLKSWTERDAPHMAPKLGWPVFEGHLRRLLELENSLGVTAKALDVMVQHQRVFHSARVMTDVRPIFPESSTETPAAAVIIHTLAIQSWTSRELKAIHVALDGQDVLALRDVLDRALKKESALRLKFETPALPFLK